MIDFNIITFATNYINEIIMILYNVTVNIDQTVEQEWLQWMKEVHIPEVMATGMFLENKIFKLLVEEEQGTTYSFQYFAKSIKELNQYLQKFAPALQQDHAVKYNNKFVAFRSMLELVD